MKHIGAYQRDYDEEPLDLDPQGWVDHATAQINAEGGASASETPLRPRVDACPCDQREEATR